MNAPSGASLSKNDGSLGIKTYTNISKFDKIYLLLTIMTITRLSKRIRWIACEMHIIRTSESWNLSRK